MQMSALARCDTRASAYFFADKQTNIDAAAKYKLQSRRKFTSLYEMALFLHSTNFKWIVSGI